MANNNTYKGITVKFGADTTELGKALRDIDTEAKSVSADIKEIDKGLKIDPKNVDLTVQKINKLGEGIQTASKRLEILKSAQASARQEMEKGTEGAEQRYKSLQREIQKTENELAKMKQQAKQASDTMKKELTDSVTQFAGQIAKLSAAVAAVITALGGLTLSAASSADEINTLSKVTGISTEELQKFSYASDLIDVSMSTLQGSLTKLTRNMNTAKDGTGDAYEAFKALGVEIADSGGNLRNNTEVFYEVIDALGEIDNATQRDAYAMQIFGRSAQELNPLILAGSDALREFGEEADSMGIIFDQETLDNLNEFKDKVDVAKQQLKGAATIVGGELVNSFNALFDGANGLLDMVQKAKADGTLQKIAGSVADAVSMLIEILSSAVKFVIKFRDAIALGVTALVAYKAALGISNIVHALANAVKVFTAAQTEANAAAALNPYAVLAAAAVAATVAIVKFCTAQNEATEAQNRYYDSVVKSLHENNEAVKSFDNLKDSIDSANASMAAEDARIEAEYYGYEKLIARLYELNDAQKSGKDVRKEMADIVEQLESNVEGLTIAYNKETGELISQRGELEQTIQKTKELMLAKSALKNQEKIAEQISEAELTVNMLEPDYQKAEEEYKKAYTEIIKKWKDKLPAVIQEGMNQAELESAMYNYSSNGHATKEFEDDYRRFKNLRTSFHAIHDVYTDATKTLNDLNKKYDENQKKIDENSKALEKLNEEQSGSTETEDEAADAVEKLSKAYDDAKSKVSSYRSELTSLISTLDKVSSGTKYSTTQILDLLSQYPELTNSVHLTSEGYEIEAEAIQKLIDKKADLMLTEAKEAEETAKKAAFKASEEYNSAIRSGLANKENLGELGQQVREAHEAWRQAENTVVAIERVTADIKNNNLVQSAADSASKGKGSSTDLWKQAAEAEIAEAEHLYKMGEISAEEYYNRLTDINRRYYENRAQYLEEYRKLEETVYSGLKKQSEEQLSNMKSLLDRINAVKQAKQELENAENQKVSVYSSAAGFHTEQNAAAIDKAASSLQSKTLELASLLQQKYGMNINMPDISGIDLSAILPDLSGIRIPSAAAGSSRQVTVNYTAGDVIINGNADSSTVDRLKALMNSESKKFFEQYLADYLDRADMDRQTGG